VERFVLLQEVKEISAGKVAVRHRRRFRVPGFKPLLWNLVTSFLDRAFC
jgi:hypothetical protein